MKTCLCCGYTLTEALVYFEIVSPIGRTSLCRRCMPDFLAAQTDMDNEDIWELDRQWKAKGRR